MAVLMRNAVPQIKGFARFCRITSVEGELDYVSSICFSNFLSTASHCDRYKKQMWKRIKKNDLEMDYFLSSSSTQERIKDLSKCMDCSNEEATELVKRDSFLAVTDINNLQKRIKLLKSYQFSTQDIISNPSVLHRTYDVLQQRLSTFKSLNCSADKMSLSALKKTDTDFKIFVKNRCEEVQFLSQFSSHQDCLEALLECGPEKAEELIVNNGLMNVSPVLLKKKIEVLKSYHIPNNSIQSILKDLINRSLAIIQTRLQLFKDENVLDDPDLKLGYLLLCKQKELEKSIATLKANQQALEGCKNKQEYLVLRLKCSKKVAEGLAQRRPIVSMSTLKLQKMLDFFLIDVNASSDFVLSNLNLMNFSVERMQYRWPIIRSLVQKNAKLLSHLLNVSDDTFENSMKT